MDKLYSEDYEKALLGCMLLDNSIITETMVLVQKQFFNNLNHQKIFETICDIYDTNSSCDLVMVCQKLPAIADKIAELTSVVASPSNYEFYASEIRKFHTARTYRQFVYEHSDKITKDNVDDVLAETDDFVSNCLNSVTKVDPDDSKVMSMNIIKSIQEAYQSKGALQGFDTGIEQLNDLLGGLQTGNLVTIGARPSIGKSAFADQLQMNLAMKGAKTCMFSYEMTSKEIGLRRTAVLSGIPVKKLKSGFLNQPDFGKINQACSQLYNTDMLLYDSSKISFNFTELVSKVRVHAKQGYKIFFIDHIGLLEYDVEPYLKDHEKISKMTKKLKKMATTLDIVIIDVCQLTRDTEGKEPMLNSLRGSGSIEQDSNIVMFIHRERQQQDEATIPTKLLIVKDRDGACGEINFDFIPQTTKFREIIKPNGKYEKPIYANERNEKESFAS